MKKIIFILLLFASSCMMPYSTYDYTEPTRVYYQPVYTPTKVVIIKKKPKHKYKRHVKVKVNKPRKRK